MKRNFVMIIIPEVDECKNVFFLLSLFYYDIILAILLLENITFFVHLKVCHVEHEQEKDIHTLM